MKAAAAATQPVRPLQGHQPHGNKTKKPFSDLPHPCVCAMASLSNPIFVVVRNLPEGEGFQMLQGSKNYCKTTSLSIFYIFNI